MQQEDLEMREQVLFRELFQSSILCHFCQLSEELLRCDILLDQTNCEKHICVDCLNKKKDDPCECGRKYSEHYFRDKIKKALKSNLVDKASLHFVREKKIRKNVLFQNIDYDLVNMLAYLSQNPTNAKRISFLSVEDSIKKCLREKKKEERTLSNEKSTRKKAVYISRITAHDKESGLESCGYDLTYQKGINLVLKSFLTHTSEKPLLTKIQPLH